ncbi:hypothetical protein SUSAZ_07520 [Sulfolobus acidocaldarius SUSAZ]|nr:hypothetical protein SUSAZ_07520 [Sulfolobus acidocaldarius SUSAZ]
MKLRINKIPKSEEDLDTIRREIEDEHQHDEHGEHIDQHMLDEILSALQQLQIKINETKDDTEKCKGEISRIYSILSKLVVATFTEDKDQRIKILRELLSQLE